jgi:hypothetical protein
MNSRRMSPWHATDAWHQQASVPAADLAPCPLDEFGMGGQVLAVEPERFVAVVDMLSAGPAALAADAVWVGIGLAFRPGAARPTYTAPAGTRSWHGRDGSG